MYNKDNYLFYTFSDVFASMAPVAGAPLLGFNEVPSVPLSLFDIHGMNDGTIPYDLDHGAGGHLKLNCWSDEIFHKLFSTKEFCLCLVWPEDETEFQNHLQCFWIHLMY